MSLELLFRDKLGQVIQALDLLVSNALPSSHKNDQNRFVGVVDLDELRLISGLAKQVRSDFEQVFMLASHDIQIRAATAIAELAPCSLQGHVEGETRLIVMAAMQAMRKLLPE